MDALYTMPEGAGQLRVTLHGPNPAKPGKVDITVPVRPGSIQTAPVDLTVPASRVQAL